MNFGRHELKIIGNLYIFNDNFFLLYKSVGKKTPSERMQSLEVEDKLFVFELNC